jgi:uncharacterized protein
VQRMFWSGLGVVSLGLGLIGIVLPLLPTTPFVLLAAFAFSRSSPRLHAWLLGHPRLGPAIRNWQRSGAIAPKAKALAMVSLVATFAISLMIGIHGWILAAQALALLGVATFILSRPSQ